MAEIGKWNTLMAVEQADHGLMLDGGEEHGQILAPSRYLPEDAEPGEMFEVFVYLDSEDRLIATTEQPLVQVGEFACLEVISVNPRVGAFLNWGLAKDLLLPFAEQLGGGRHRPRIGDRVVVAVQVDKRSQRIIASMRTNRYLDRSAPLYDDGQPVKVLVCEKTPLGFKAIIENRHLGLFYHSDLGAPLRIGETIDAFIRSLRPDGKIDLSLEKPGDTRQRVASLTDDILEALRSSPNGTLALGDKSPPEKIRRVFGVSKKAYKQALGSLYRERKIEFVGDGVKLVSEG